MTGRPARALVKDLRERIRLGHPWIYERALARARADIAPGALVIVTHGGDDIAIGFADPGSPIAVRVLASARGVRADRGERALWAAEDAFGGAWAAERAEQAARVRTADPRLAGLDSMRLVHGENDYMPGLVIDRYADTGVVMFDGAGAAGFWEPRIDGVCEGLRRGGVELARLWARPLPRVERGGAGRVLRGDAPPARIPIHEGEARFEVDVRAGQKTGFFLDQRRNRMLVGELAAGAEVLNLYAYTGGFSVHAALGGAQRVSSVDIARPAIASARDNFALNGLDPDAHEFAAEDALAFLERVQQRGRRFDLVIVDPPSFAPSERAKPKALRAYGKVNELALRVVAAGGTLVSASCSSHVGGADMSEMLAQAAARAGRVVRIVEQRGADRDHPVRPGFPEGEYLQALFLSVA